jgi:competence protein ComFC
MLEIILDIIAPSRCIVCSAPVGSRACNICEACLDKISLIRDQCPVCSGFLFEGHCRICSERTFYPSSNISIAEYRGVMKKLLHRLKFNDDRRLHIPAGLLALKEISRRKVRADIITCVPMNARKKWKRGFNQSALIAKLIAKETDTPFRPLLKEKRKTVTQRELGLRQRFINVINRYQVRKRADLKDKSVMIIDDVFTTGATVNECARVLRAAGAKDVFSVTIARSSMHRLEKS